MNSTGTDHGIFSSRVASDSCSVDPLEQYISENYPEKTVTKVRWDGHCLVYAVTVCLKDVGYHTDCKSVMKSLSYEITMNKDYYQGFLVSGHDVCQGLKRYIDCRDYPQEKADVVLPALCNQLRVKAVVLIHADNRVTERIVFASQWSPSSCGTIYLALIGSGLGAHYNPVVSGQGLTQLTTEPEQLASPDTSTGDTSYQAPEDCTQLRVDAAQSANSEQSISEILAGLNKPSPPHVSVVSTNPGKRRGKTKRRKRKSAVLTDTPEKLNLVKEKSRKKSQRPRRKVLPPQTQTAGTDWHCIVCQELWSYSKPGEKWIKCRSCPEWAHLQCTSVVHRTGPYPCHGCRPADKFNFIHWLKYDPLKLSNLRFYDDFNLFSQCHDHITEMKKKHLPYKFEKFHKHKHKNNKWISFGIIRSIKTRDEMYLKFKRCNQQNVEYDALKNNLHVFNRILKKAIREAKIQYYDKLFEQHRSDIKKTWQTISDIICKSNTKRKTLDKIIVDSKVIKDKGEICDKFNDFFANIGPKLATQIKPISNKTYDTFLKKRLLMSFAFTLVAENDVLKHLSSLRTKKLCRHWWNFCETVKKDKFSLDKSLNINNQPVSCYRDLPW